LNTITPQAAVMAISISFFIQSSYGWRLQRIRGDRHRRQ
jgi:hypothetical protein